MVRHITGIFLWLAEIGLINQAKSEILEFSKEYIDYLKEKDLLLVESIDQAVFQENEHWGGLGFHEKNSEEFKSLNDYIERQRHHALMDSYPEKGKKILDLIDENPQLFYQKIVSNNEPENLFFQIPILSYIDQNDFVKTFINADRESKKYVCYALAKRYAYDDFNASLLPELLWLKNVIELLEEERSLLDGKISGYQLHRWIEDYFKKAYESLKNYESVNHSQSET